MWCPALFVICFIGYSNYSSQIKGAGVFDTYLNRPDATAETFTSDGWFKTGDVAMRGSDGYYRILGRLSADIIKSGGYKISALDIERVLLEHPDIAEVAVFGLPDETYGERVAAVVVCKSGSLDPAALNLKSWGKAHLPPYQIPSIVHCVAAIPRNAMGKVNKKELKKTYTH